MSHHQSNKLNKTYIIIGALMVSLGAWLWWACAQANRELEAVRTRILADGGVLTVEDLASAYPRDVDYFVGYPQETTMAYLLSEKMPDINPELRTEKPWMIAEDAEPPEVYMADVSTLKEQAYLIQQLKDMLAQPLTHPDDLMELTGANQTFIMQKIPGMMSARDAADVLAWNAYMAHQNGESDAALEYYESIFRLGQHISQSPTIISSMTGIAVITIPKDQLADIIIDAPFSDEAKDSFETLLESYRVEDYFKISCQGELLSVIEIFDRLKGGDRDILPIFNSSESLENRIFGTAARLPMFDFIYSHDEATALGYHQTNIEQLDAPYVQSVSQPLTLQIDWRTPISKIALPGISRAHAGVVLAKLYLTQLRVALAINRYRQATGEYPEAIDLLVPEYLEAVPLNPMENTPIALEYIETLMPEGEVRFSLGDKKYMLFEYKLHHSDTAQGLLIY